jgi:acyl-CoA synthetase (AMP-forming)/AMP-acid ligase II
MLSHGNLLSNAQVLKQYWAWQPNDVLIHALPIFHVHGLFVAIHGALLNGSTMLWMNRFEPRRAIALMAQATVFMGVPTLYTRMLAEPALSHQATASVRLFVAGSAPLLLETFTQWQERTGHTILERYGMSETLMLTSNPYLPNGPGQPTARRGGTVGLPSKRDKDGNYLYEIDMPTGMLSGLEAFIEACKYLQDQITSGIGVPPELLQAEASGSGYSGRRIPMEGFLANQQQIADAFLMLFLKYYIPTIVPHHLHHQLN